MASNKFDLSSGSPDRPMYSAGNRGSHPASSIDRSGSFRESMDNSVSSSVPNLSRNTSSVGQSEVLNFLQCLPFGLKPMPLDHRPNRQGDLKRNIAVALGISPDNSPSSILKGKLVAPPSQEELKRVKLGLRECSSKARERIKFFDEALSVINKSFPSVSTKKRSRSEVFSGDRSGPMLSNDRPMNGQGPGKVGSQNNIISGDFEHDLQKPEERTKSSVPSKRRTSLADVKDIRGHGSMRSSGPAVDRDRELPKLANSGSVQCDDRTLPIADGWKKSNMKKKRSVIKPDASSGVISTKPIEGYREPKQGMQQRSINNARPRLSNDSHGFRRCLVCGNPFKNVDSCLCSPHILALAQNKRGNVKGNLGPSGFSGQEELPPTGSEFGNGTLGAAKSETLSQQTGLPSRASNPKVDINGSSLSDKRDRSMGPDKERVNIKAINKVNCRDDFNSSPTSNSRMSTPVRAPRSSSGTAPKLAPLANRASVSNDWEIGHCTNRPPPSGGDNNRKRAASARSSSPPTSQLSTGKYQKTNRSARRTNLGPAASSNEEASPMDSVSDTVEFPRHLPISSPQLVKLKGNLLSPSPMSEGEDSGATETKNGKSGHHFQKLSTIALSSRKNKSVSGEDHGDGSRRHGRAGRGFISSRSPLPMSGEKLGHEETAKQLRSARIGPDKSESKAGRPPTRRLSDRKSYTRQKHTSINSPADFLDDGHEELLAAANAVINPKKNQAQQSFWREKEPLFGFISDVDIDYLKQQENLGSAFGMQNHIHADTDSCIGSSVFGLVESQREPRLHNAGGIEAVAEDQSMVSLSERLLAALIPEEEADDYCISENDDLMVDAYRSRHDLDGNLESNGFSYESFGSTPLNGYMETGMPEYHEHGNGILRTRSSSGFDRPINGLLVDQELTPGRACSGSPYDSMDINEKLLLEMHSVGIFPEALPKTDRPQSGGIDDDISELTEKYHMQASKKKGLLDRLLTSTLETKESQEKEFEQLALDELVGMAYGKYMMCQGYGGSGGKNSNTKMAKQAALAFTKRTLERCKEFEDTGKSCFSEPLFKDIFSSGSSRLARLTDTNGEASKRPRQNTDQYDVTSDVLLPTNHLSEQTTDKEETWLNRVKKRELLLDDVVGNAIGNSFSAMRTLVSSTKGKRSERDREGKGMSRGASTKGKSSVSNTKGERKSKAKPKQKTTQLSVSINGLLGNNNKITLDQSKQGVASTSTRNTKEKVELGLNLNPLAVDDETEVLDFSHLQLPGMDVLGSDDLGGQGQDLASWLNIDDDDNLQDHDFLGLEGLEIPMDDLSDLNMMV